MSALPPESAIPSPPDKSSEPRRRRITKFALRVTVSVALLAYLATQIDFAQAWAVLRQASGPMLLVLLGVFIFERLFAAYRWHVLLRRRCPDVTFATTLRITFISNFVGAFLPGAVGIEALRIYHLARHTQRLAEAFTSVFLDRLLGVISLLLMVLVSLTLTTRIMPGNFVIVAWAMLALVIVLCIMLVHPGVRRAIDRLMPRWLGRRLGDRLQRLYASIDAYRRDRALLAWGLVLAIAMQLLRVAATFLAARALGIDMPILDFFIFVPIIMFAVMLPISIGGWGVREAAFIHLFALAGVKPEAAVVLSVMIYFMDIIATLPGAYFHARGVAPAATVSHQPAAQRERS